MIVSQAQKVRAQLVTLKKLEEDEKNRTDIEATYNELERVAVALRQFYSLYRLVGDRLNVQQTSDIIAQVQQIDKDIKTSREDFAHERRQVKTLQGVNQKLGELNQSAGAGWKLYALNQLKPQVELLKLVKKLPEMLAQQNEIANLQERLEEFTQRTPSGKAELAEFDQGLGRLAESLSNLNLASTIKAFLTAVLQDEATLDDLSDDILTWCQQGSRAKTFKITFK